MRKVLPFLLFSAVVLACTEYDRTAPIEPTFSQSGYLKSAEDELLPDSTWVVLFKRNRVSNGAVRASALTQAAGGVLRSVFPSNGGFSAKLAPAAVEALRAHPDVRVIAPNSRVAVYGHASQSNVSWGLDRIDGRLLSQLDSTYTYTATGDGVHIYVVDTGTNEIGEFGTRLNSPLGSADDCATYAGHGTPIAAIAAGSTHGVAKNASVYRLNTLCGIGDIEETIPDLIWLANNAQLPAVANLSWGNIDESSGGGSGGQDECLPGELCLPLSGGFAPKLNAALDSAVLDLVAAGITVVAAAGNAGANACLGSPGHLAEVITVAAVDASDDRWVAPGGLQASNYGTCVDIFAPGVGVTSARQDGGTATFSATSFAAPFVTGVVALYLEESPALSPAAVKNLLIWRSSGVSIGAGGGSPNRVLFSLVRLELSMDTAVVDGPGQYDWDAIPTGGIGHYTYQWYRRWVYPDGYKDPWQTLSTAATQQLTLDGWEPEFELRVDVNSGWQAGSDTVDVDGHCDPCVEFQGGRRGY